MRHLIITAHPSSKGFTHRIAKTFLHKANDSGDDCEILDLYNQKFSQDFLKFENVSKFPIDKITLEIQEKIRLADNLVFVCPMWWGMCPAIMKNFFDRNFTKGFAYKYVVGKKIPDKLLSGKSAQIFMTCDGPGFFYTIFGNPGGKFLNFTLKFCGVKVKDFVLFSNKRLLSDEDLESCLKKVERKV